MLNTDLFYGQILTFLFSIQSKILGIKDAQFQIFRRIVSVLFVQKMDGGLIELIVKSEKQNQILSIDINIFIFE